MSENSLVYSIQRTYILTHVLTPEREIVTCNQRIDIPTIEPLTEMKAVVYPDEFSKIIPCIELAGNFLSEFNLEFETNEGVTVLPVKIGPGRDNPLENPYPTPRYVLVLPRGATGVKSCKLIQKATGKEVQHNFTFGLMLPPYNYDNALFGYLSYRSHDNHNRIIQLENKTSFYGYIRSNGSHTIDFSKPGSTFSISRNTRLIVFSLTNKSSGNVSFEITLTSVRDPNIHTTSTAIIPSGRSTIKIDLQSLEMYVMTADNNAKNIYNVSCIQDSYYGGIKFGYNPNQNLTGNVEVHEWA